MDTTERPAAATLTADEARGDYIEKMRDVAAILYYAREWSATPDGTRVYYDPTKDRDVAQGIASADFHAETNPHWLIRLGLGRDGSLWHRVQQQSFKIHPVVTKMLRQYAPTDLQQMVAEWPHVATTDPTKLAFTRDNAAGIADRQIVTNVGKYLSRHWPHVPEHERRDAQASHVPADCMVLTTLPEMIEALEMGPQSCMVSTSIYCSHAFKRYEHTKFVDWRRDKTQPEPDWTAHPYSVYDPTLGWGLAVRRSKNGDISGRALVYGLTPASNVTCGKCFVRTYVKRSDQDAQSSDDHQLQQFLEQQGFTHHASWPKGTEFAKAMHRNRYLMPYMDGGTRYRSSPDGSKWIADDEGRYEGDSTISGFHASEDEDEDEDESARIGHCDRCDLACYEGDDHIYVGRDADSLICDGCSDDYSSVRGHSRWNEYREYYVHNNDAVEVDKIWYDSENLPESIVELADGDYAHRDACVEFDGDWYELDDGQVVKLHVDDESGDTHGLRESCWQDVNADWWCFEQNKITLTDGRQYMIPETTTDDLVVEFLCERYGPDEARDLEIIKDFGEQKGQRPLFEPELVGPPVPSVYNAKEMLERILSHID